MSANYPSLLTLKAVLAVGAGLVALSGTVGAMAQGKEPDAFNRDAASNALKAVNIARCKKPKGPTGDGHKTTRDGHNYSLAGGVPQIPVSSNIEMGGLSSTLFPSPGAGA